MKGICMCIYIYIYIYIYNTYIHIYIHTYIHVYPESPHKGGGPGSAPVGQTQPPSPSELDHTHRQLKATWRMSFEQEYELRKTINPRAASAGPDPTPKPGCPSNDRRNSNSNHDSSSSSSSSSRDDDVQSSQQTGFGQSTFGTRLFGSLTHPVWRVEAAVEI